MSRVSVSLAPMVLETSVPSSEWDYVNGDAFCFWFGQVQLETMFVGGNFDVCAFFFFLKNVDTLWQ